MRVRGDYIERGKHRGLDRTARQERKEARSNMLTLYFQYGGVTKGDQGIPYLNIRRGARRGGRDRRGDVIRTPGIKSSAQSQQSGKSVKGGARQKFIPLAENKSDC